MKKVIEAIRYYWQWWGKRPKKAAVALFVPLIIGLPIMYLIAGWWWVALCVIVAIVIEIYLAHSLYDYLGLGLGNENSGSS